MQRTDKRRLQRLTALAMGVNALASLISICASPASASPDNLKLSPSLQAESPEVAVPSGTVPTLPAVPNNQGAPSTAGQSSAAPSASSAAPSASSAAQSVSPAAQTVPVAQPAAPPSQPTPSAAQTTTSGTAPAPTTIPAPTSIPAKPSAAQTAPTATGQTSPTAAQPTPANVSLEPIELNQHAAPLTHDQAKTLSLFPLYLSKSIEMHSFDALRKEQALTQEISLQDAIKYVLDEGMQIKISRESMNYQHVLSYSGLASFLPTYTTQYNLGYANVFNQYTTSVSQTFLTGISMPVFQGGAVLYSYLTQRYREKAWREAYKATVSDVFLDVYQKYTNLILQRVLCQTLGKAVEGDEQQLAYARAKFKNDTGTRYEIMQVEALMSSDKQAFLQQAVAMRQAGLALNLALNYPLSINLVPVEQTLTEAPLFDTNVQLKTLLQDTMRFNAGLRQYENFRLAAARNVQAQSASLYPQVSFFALYQINDATVSPMANGAALGGAATSAIDNFLDTTFAGRVSNNALGQQYTFSPTAGSTSTQGANTGPSAMPAASGGTPIAQVQSGSLVSSGAVAPSIFGGGTGASSGPNANGSLQAPAGIFPGLFREVQGGFSLSWNLPNFGVQTSTTIAASKVLARQALMQCNQEVSIVVQQVRGDYLAYLSDREAIDKAAATTAATKESLQYAKARLSQGVSTELDVIRAQHDYIAALTAQAQAIVASNVAQAQLLHDMGVISASTLTEGYKAGNYVPTRPTGGRRSF